MDDGSGQGGDIEAGQRLGDGEDLGGIQGRQVALQVDDGIVAAARVDPWRAAKIRSEPEAGRGGSGRQPARPPARPRRRYPARRRPPPPGRPRLHGLGPDPDNVIGTPQCPRGACRGSRLEAMRAGMITTGFMAALALFLVARPGGFASLAWPTLGRFSGQPAGGHTGGDNHDCLHRGAFRPEARLRPAKGLILCDATPQ